MKTVAIIQARMNSTRLFGKIMIDIEGHTVLGHVVTRAQACPRLDEVIVATTVGSDDDATAQESLRYGATIFRGSEEDVLARYHGAAQEAGADIIVRITSDCPLYDAELLTRMLDEFEQRRSCGEQIDFLSNTLDRTFPRGLDTEIFTRAALEAAHREAERPGDREHVTPFIHRNSQRFGIAQYRHHEDLSRNRWTLDTNEDLCFIREIYSALKGEKIPFSTETILNLLQARPSLTYINSHVEQKS